MEFKMFAIVLLRFNFSIVLSLKTAILKVTLWYSGFLEVFSWEER